MYKCTKFGYDYCDNSICCLLNVDLFTLSGDGRRFEQRLIDMMIPESYLQLQEIICCEAKDFRLHKEKGPPILLWNDILKYESVHEYR